MEVNKNEIIFIAIDEQTKNTLHISLDRALWNEIIKYNDGKYLDFFLSEENINILFPQWKCIVNPNDIFMTLPYNNLEKFKKLIIHYDGEINTYNITNIDVFPPTNDEGEIEVRSVNDDINHSIMFTIHFE